LKEPAETVLVVEDDVEMQNFLRDVLAPENLAVHAAAKGDDGIKQARAIRPDLILLDLRLPGLDGVAFCNTIRADNRTQNIPIIVVTGTQSREQLVESMTAGADDFVSKPIDVGDLLKRVRAMLKWKHITDPVERFQRYIETVREMGGQPPSAHPAR
jgi:DNA-binding response OmpR family regulator